MKYKFILFLPGYLKAQLFNRTQRVLGTVMGDAFPNHISNSYYRNPTFYYIGTLHPLGKDAPHYLGT